MGAPDADLVSFPSTRTAIGSYLYPNVLFWRLDVVTSWRVLGAILS